MSRCRGCGQEIVWAVTKRERKVPLDPEPDPIHGTIYLDGERAFFLRGGTLEFARKNGEPLYVAHFVTCPKAKAFRR